MFKVQDWFDRAQKEHFALGAFNVDNFDVLKAVVEKAFELKSPVIVEASPGEEKSLGLRNLVAIVNNYKSEYQIPIFLNLDHADDEETINNSLELGFDLVHFDGSKLPLEENTAIAKRITALAKSKNVLVEGEIDRFPGESKPFSVLTTNDQQPTTSNQYTDPQAAQEFVTQTGVDILAVFVGNKHGTYADQSEHLDLEKLQELKKALPDTFFSLHGGSGIPDEEVKQAISSGIVKVNINTQLRVAFRETLENTLKGNPEEYTWYRLTPAAIESVKEVVENKIRLFGNAEKT